MTCLNDTLLYIVLFVRARSFYQRIYSPRRFCRVPREIAHAGTGKCKSQKIQWDSQRLPVWFFMERTNVVVSDSQSWVHRHSLRCKPMTATRYSSIALSGRVVACGNIIFKPSETTPNRLSAAGKIAPHLHRIQHFPTCIGRFAQNGGLGHNGMAPIEMHGI